ncbi:MAG: response regulator [Chitinophagaceae bacterium]|nr:response regulator [Chitinophagaceae bacterium]
MPQTKLKYVLLSIFIGSILFLIFLQFNANRSINDVVSGNNQLKDELVLKNNLQKLSSDLLSMEAKIKGAVIANDTAHLVRIEKEIDLIKEDISRIGGHTEVLNKFTRPLFDELKAQVLQKTSYSNAILDTLDVAGKRQAERMVNNPEQGSRLTNKILATIHQLDAAGETNAINFSNQSDMESRKALKWSKFTVIAACIFALIAFLFIAARIKRQEELIRALNAAQKKEKELSAVKEQFLANMSHEIRTPMNAVLGFVNLLQKQNLNAQSKEYVNAISSSGENLMTIINDILDISKIEAGMLRIKKAPFSLRELLHSVEVMFQAKLEHTDIKLQTVVDETVPDYLNGDSMRLTQILANLISNAVKFTASGSIDVTVNVPSIKEGAIILQLKVSDTGIGISPEKLQSIFDRFNQADADTTRKYGGTGLGLAIVKQLAELQNGTVMAESKLNAGSVFTVEIPYETIEEKVYEKEAGQKIITKNRALAARILIAEDNSMNQSLMKHLMNDWQMPYVLVNNGKEALELLRTEHFDLLLLDIQMPLMNGYTTAQLIRTELKNNIPIIAMTAHALKGEREKCISYGMNDYISKPIREEQLLELIQQYTEKNHKPGQSQLPPYPMQSPANSFSVINLHYLKQLSKGNIEFEKAMTQEFILQVPEQLSLLKNAIAKNEWQLLKDTAHNMKTSVSYMGLLETLAPHLNDIERSAGNKEHMNSISNNYEAVAEVCFKAIDEAKMFLAQN